MTVSTNATQLSQFESASRMAALNGGARPTSPVTQPAPTVTAQTGEAASAQATEGAAQTQQKPEAFNAPPLDLPDNPSTLDVMAGLTRAMADPSVNASTAQKLFSLHEQLMQAEKAMLQVIVDGMLI